MSKTHRAIAADNEAFMPVEEMRALLGDVATGMTDDEVRAERDAMRAFARSLFDVYRLRCRAEAIAKEGAAR